MRFTTNAPRVSCGRRSVARCGGLSFARQTATWPSWTSSPPRQQSCRRVAIATEDFDLTDVLTMSSDELMGIQKLYLTDEDSGASEYYVVIGFTQINTLGTSLLGASKSRALEIQARLSVVARAMIRDSETGMTWVLVRQLLDKEVQP